MLLSSGAKLSNAKVNPAMWVRGGSIFCQGLLRERRGTVFQPGICCPLLSPPTPRDHALCLTLARLNMSVGTQPPIALYKASLSRDRHGRRPNCLSRGCHRPCACWRQQVSLSFKKKVLFMLFERRFLVLPAYSKRSLDMGP